MLDETNQQSEGQPGEPINNSPKTEAKSDPIASLLIEKASVSNFKRHASLGRQNANRGHKANLTAGHHYLECQGMLNHKEKGPWFKAEAEAIGTTVRTLYTYINMAKDEIWIEQQPVRLAMFLNSTPAEQRAAIRKAMTEAAKMNIDFDAKKEAVANKEADDVEQEEEAKDEAAVAAYLSPDAYTITIPDVPQVMRTALDKLQTTDKWKVFLRDARMFLATDLVRLGSLQTTVSELLHPSVPQPTDENLTGEDTQSEDNSAKS
jgi:hypothetical protein